MIPKKLQKEPFNLVVAGVGGQGNVLLSALVGAALVNEGFMVTVADTFGVSQRGGSVTSHVRVSEKTSYSSITLKGKADIILGMEPIETIRALGEFGNPDVFTIVNPRPIYTMGGIGYPDMEDVNKAIRGLSSEIKFVYATEEALKMGNPIYSNIIFCGALVGAEMLPIDKQSIVDVLKERFSGKILESNIKAFDKGMELIANA